MKNILLSILLLTAVNSLQAQTNLQQANLKAYTTAVAVKSTENSIRATVNSVNTTAKLVGDAKNLAGKVFGKKKEAPETENQATTSATTSGQQAKASAHDTKTVTITVNNCDYQMSKTVNDMLSTSPDIKDVTRTFSGSTATFVVACPLGGDALADYLDARLQGRITIEGVDAGTVTLSFRK